jgi:hypothetical protein
LSAHIPQLGAWIAKRDLRVNDIARPPSLLTKDAKVMDGFIPNETIHIHNFIYIKNI